MSKREENLWQGIDAGVRDALKPRDYRSGSSARELSQRGVDASELVAADRNESEIKEAWIPGVEIFARKIYAQRHRGVFGEFKHGKRFSCASAEHSKGQYRSRLVAARVCR